MTMTTMGRFVRVSLLLSVVILLLLTGQGCEGIRAPTPTPSFFGTFFANAEPTREAKTSKTHGGGSKASNSNSNTCQQQQQQQPHKNNFIFGISRRIPALLSLRGGQVLEPSSLEEVESILVRSGVEQKLVVIDFTATWCGPCKMIAPLFEELSDTMQDVVFLKVDVDENPDTAAKYNVSAMPTFVFIKAGEVVDRLMGANPSRLQELIEEHKHY